MKLNEKNLLSLRLDISSDKLMMLKVEIVKIWNINTILTLHWCQTYGSVNNMFKSKYHQVKLELSVLRKEKLAKSNTS